MSAPLDRRQFLGRAAWGGAALAGLHFPAGAQAAAEPPWGDLMGRFLWHGREGRGDGPRAGELYDDWNKRKLGVPTADLARRYRLPLQGLRPRNFTEGIFRGGDRGVDLYWRIAIGIKGTPMPAFGPSPAGPGVLSPAEIWDVVRYVGSLSGGRGPIAESESRPVRNGGRR